MASAKVEEVGSILSSLSIAFDSKEHEEAKTCDIHRQVLGDIDAILAKNVFVYNKATKDKFLLVMRPEVNLSNSDLRRFLNVKGTKNLRFVAANDLDSLLGVKAGAVTPLAVFNDKDNVVRVYLDKTMMESGKSLGVHPLTNEATVFISAADLVKYLTHFDHKPKIMDFDAPTPEPAKPSKSSKSSKGKSGTSTTEKGAGLTVKKKANFPQWYHEVITKGEMIEYYDISGCFILRPDAYFIWEQVQKFFNNLIVKNGVRNCYFPMFVSQRALQAESDHVQDFTPEVAWVTKAGKKPLNEHIAIRPTSECVMYPSYAKWIKSHRDLPLRLNQWSNIVRWEFKHATPFIRTREFLWQEGHSAFETKEEADEEVLKILDFYARVYEECLAVPVIKGVKTEGEKFPGGDYTTTVETFIDANGRGVQGATSHGLGQNFGKMFNIEFEDKQKKKRIPYQNSWGLTTRTIGVMIMVHGDDRGLVIPPRVASFQIVIIPIIKKSSAEERANFKERYTAIAKTLEDVDLRVKVDDAGSHNPGWKYNHWELRGVPLRIEFGPKDLANDQCVAVRRDNFSKEKVPLANIAKRIPEILEEIQAALFDKAKAVMLSRQHKVTEWADLIKGLSERCHVLAPSCDEVKCEESIKERTKEEFESEEFGDETAPTSGDSQEPTEKLTGAAKSLCKPYDQPELPDGTSCIACDKKATTWTLYGRSY